MGTANHIHNDGGRAEAGRRGHIADCVARAIAIAAELPYQQVYDALAVGNMAKIMNQAQRKDLRPP